MTKLTTAMTTGKQLREGASAPLSFIMNKDNQMWTWILDMCIAAYMHRDPDVQVRRMAKRYKKLTNNKTIQRTLKTIIKSSRPSLVVKVTYDELTS